MVLNFTILYRFTCFATFGSILFICIPGDAQTWVRVIAYRPPVIDTKCWTILPFEHRSSVRFPVADEACLHCVAFVSKCMFPLLAVMELNMRNFFWCVCHCFIGICYQNLVCRLLSWFNRQSLVFVRGLEYWACDCNIELWLRRHAKEIFSGGQTIELLVISFLHRPSHSVKTRAGGQSWNGVVCFVFGCLRSLHNIPAIS